MQSRLRISVVVFFLTTVGHGLAQPPHLSIQMNRAGGQPLLNWVNAPGQVGELEILSRLQEEPWRRWVAITADSPTACWIDESHKPTHRFYRLRISSLQRLERALQAALDSVRKDCSIPGVSAAAVVPQHGLWVGTSEATTIAEKWKLVRRIVTDGAAGEELIEADLSQADLGGAVLTEGQTGVASQHSTIRKI